MGRLHLGLGLAATQARAGEASGCIPVWGWNGSWLHGGGSGGQDWPHPQDRAREERGVPAGWSFARGPQVRGVCEWCGLQGGGNPRISVSIVRA